MRDSYVYILDFLESLKINIECKIGIIDMQDIAQMMPEEFQMFKTQKKTYQELLDMIKEEIHKIEEAEKLDY